MDDKFYHIDKCPYCKKYALIEAGYSMANNLIVKCEKCGRFMLVDDIEKIRDIEQSRKDYTEGKCKTFEEWER